MSKVDILRNQKADTDLLKDALDIVSRHAAERGILARSSYDGHFRFFTLLPTESPRRPQIVRMAQAWAASCIHSASRPPPVGSHETREMLSFFLNKANLRVPSDLLERLEFDDCIHAYDENHETIYASYDFLKLVSYSLEELVCSTWYDLYLSDSERVRGQFLNLSREAVAGNRHVVVDTSYVENHVEYERRSPERRVAAMIPRLNSPIFKADGSPGGYMSMAKFLGIQPLDLADGSQIG